MLSREDNELLCRVGRGTPMGELMRQYWMPAALSSELPERDGAPLRVRLLGEDLIAFRATSGAVGLVRNSCPHRGASLFYGRNEADGLRCVYHGWKFDVAGRCVDMPNEPEESNFKQKVRAVAYPCVERAGLIWAYLGPRETPPPLPDLEPTLLPDSSIQIYQRECNWMQALEGDIDTCHTVFLHLGKVRADEAPPGTWAAYALADRAPRYAVSDMDFGVMYGAYRPAEASTDYWRIANFLFPFYAMVPTGVLGLEIRVRAWVPMDDEHTLAITVARGAQGTRNAGRQVSAQHHRLVRALPLRRQRRQRLSDRSPGAEDDQLHGYRRDLPAGPGRHREHGTDLRSHQRAPGQQRRHGHQDSQAADRRGEGATGQRQGAARRRRSECLRREIGRCRAPERRRLDRGHARAAPCRSHSP
jgi:nitrite reductase/ring-hydroxylating ferredoxin subunit